ncbi:hypothetical protein ALC60_01797 [Trachymyrmex zeteki]|uniref:Uncharacterized protein n=1 Tax=Mycetomoellerius zeteki TaxID=64791 RepID=A0A151XFU2_9HYME|nr:hypothetical protein ALC60_01797 [Trachymyrmex zeteki]
MPKLYVERRGHVPQDTVRTTGETLGPECDATKTVDKEQGSENEDEDGSYSEEILVREVSSKDFLGKDIVKAFENFTISSYPECIKLHHIHCIIIKQYPLIIIVNSPPRKDISWIKRLTLKQYNKATAPFAESNEARGQRNLTEEEEEPELRRQSEEAVGRAAARR